MLPSTGSIVHLNFHQVLELLKQFPSKGQSGRVKDSYFKNLSFPPFSMSPGKPSSKSKSWPGELWCFTSGLPQCSHFTSPGALWHPESRLPRKQQGLRMRDEDKVPKVQLPFLSSADEITFKSLLHLWVRCRLFVEKPAFVRLWGLDVYTMTFCWSYFSFTAPSCLFFPEVPLGRRPCM